MWDHVKVMGKGRAVISFSARLKASLLSLCASTVPAQQTPPCGVPPGVDPTVYSWFVAVDTDRSGSISAQELQQALTNNNWTHFNAETCRLMICTHKCEVENSD